MKIVVYKMTISEFKEELVYWINHNLDKGYTNFGFPKKRIKSINNDIVDLNVFYYLIPQENLPNNFPGFTVTKIKLTRTKKFPCIQIRDLSCESDSVIIYYNGESFSFYKGSLIEFDNNIKVIG